MHPAVKIPVCIWCNCLIKSARTPVNDNLRAPLREKWVLSDAGASDVVWETYYHNNMGDTEENTGFSDQESDFDLSSCSLSSYEEGEHESSDSDCYYSESESVSGHGVIPYDHEPEYEEGENRPQNASSESEATPESEEASRLVDTSW